MFKTTKKGKTTRSKPAKRTATTRKPAKSAPKMPKHGYQSEKKDIVLNKINTTAGPRYLVLYPATSKEFKTEAGARKHLQKRGVTDLRPRTQRDIDRSVADNNNLQPVRRRK